MDLTAWARASWAKLLDTSDGYLEDARRETVWFKSPSERWQLEWRATTLDRPRFSEAECERFGLSFATPIKLTIRQLIFDDTDARSIEDIREQEVYCGECVLPTSAGSIIVDGEPRLVRAELGPCVGLAPCERGWRAGNLWGDCIEFTPERAGVAVSIALAEDSLPSAWMREPVAYDDKPRSRSPFVEPELLKKRTMIKTRSELEALYERVDITAPNVAIGAPQSLFARAPGDGWSFEDLERVIDWVQTDEAEKLRAEMGAPVRVLGPGLIVARWIRRGLFATGHNAVARGDAMSFGTRVRPHKTADFSWFPHDAWNAKPLAQLIRARAETEAFAPRWPSAHPIAAASLARSLRVPPHIDAPDRWNVNASKKLTLAELPVCEVLDDGSILRPDRFSSRSIADALALGGALPTARPLLISQPEPAPIERSLAASIARAAGAIRSFDSDCTVLARTDEALAVRHTSDGRLEWIEARRARADERSLFREELCATEGPARAGDVLATTFGATDLTLSLGRTLRIGFDRRVSEGSLWLSTDRVGSALDATRAEEIECVVRDTRLGREEWKLSASTDSLAAVGDRVATGQPLSVVLVPTNDKDASPEEMLLAAIEGRSAGPVRERPTRWTGPDATVLERAVFARRGVDAIGPLAVERQRAFARLDARERACEALDDSTREALLEIIRDERDRVERGNDLPPGVIALARWLLSWSEPIANGRTLATRTGHRFVVEAVSAERFFEGAAQVDALVHPSMRAQIEVEARATALASDRATTVTLSPEEPVTSALEKMGAQSSGAENFALYLLRLD